MTMIPSPHPQRLFLWTIIIALSAGALAGILIFLFGRFGDLEIRLLLTTLMLSGFSFCGLCCAAIYDRPRLRPLATAGIAVAGAGFAVNLIGLWEFWESDWTWRIMADAIILAVSFAQACLLMRLRAHAPAVRRLRSATLFFIGLVALMLIWATLNEFENSNLYFRLLGVFAILDVLGSIVPPLMDWMGSPKGDA